MHCQMQVLMAFFLYKNFSVRELNKVCLEGKRHYLVRFWIWTAVTEGIDSLWV